MGIKFGEIDASQILENEFRINVLERIIDVLIQRNPANMMTPADLDRIRSEVVTLLQKKYPHSGIALKESTK